MALLGMVHVGALPGAPMADQGVERIIAVAVDEARALTEAGFDGVIIENMHDRPYVHGHQGPEVVAAMTRVGVEVRRALPGLPIGVQILSGGNAAALAVGLVAGLDFIRCENFVFSHVADEGLLERAEAGPLLRYRRMIGADGRGPDGRRVAVYCDLKKKHASHAITADVSLADAAEAAEFFGADGVIVTGTATGRPASLEDVMEVRAATRLPLLIGSGVTPETAAELLRYADGLIVGSAIKKEGFWANRLDLARCRAMAAAVRKVRR